jgi:Peptidase family S41/N-terminal domain of Peptidase_S41 in eukaryotic IRBP
MLRSVYHSLVRLHPAEFRRQFGEEMLSIFDEEEGTRARVAFGLVVDAVRSLLRQWMLRPGSWEVAPAQTEQLCNDVPSFSTLDPFRPRLAAVIQGVVLSLAVFCVTSVAIRYSWIHVLHVRIPEFQAEAPEPLASGASDEAPVLGRQTPSGHQLPARSSAARSADGHSFETHSFAQSPVSSPILRSTANPQHRTLAARPTRNAAASAGADRGPATGGVQQHSASGLAALPHSQPVQAKATGSTPLEASSPSTADSESALNVDAAEKQRVVDGAVANVEKYYFDAAVARKTAEALRAHMARGDDDAVSDPPAFADLLSSQMKEASDDQYLVVVYSLDPAQDQQPRAPTSDEIARYREEMKQTNCRFERVEILPKNIGYVKLNGFPDPSVCQATATAAMASLNNADALIFDLRDNRGGASDMVALIATYLFDRRTHLNDFYDRGNNSIEESWTQAPIPGSKLADKPVYILTSPTTFSAAEGFSYDLKMLKRATLVGETTSGAGHMGMPHRIDNHFTVRVPGIRVSNPISGTNWEGKGVEPDVKVKAGEALATAEKLAEKRIERRPDKEASQARD